MNSMTEYRAPRHGNQRSYKIHGALTTRRSHPATLTPDQRRHVLNQVWEILHQRICVGKGELGWLHIRRRLLWSNFNLVSRWYRLPNSKVACEGAALMKPLRLTLLAVVGPCASKAFRRFRYIRRFRYKGYRDLQGKTPARLRRSNPALFALTAAVAAVCLAAASRPTVVQAAGGLQDPIGPVAQPGQNVNDVLNNILVGRWDKSEIYIAPMDKQNKGAAKLPFDSDFTHVEKDKIYDGITNRAGIANGADPMGMGENTGNLDLISTSYVLNPGSTRATFGYFIKVVTPPDEAAEMGLEVSYYFALFSYDRGVASDAGPAPAATEFFLFGPFQPNGTTIPPNPPALQLGLAIGADGKLLSEVPLNLAAVANFKDKGHAKDESVKPGVDRAAKGCMVCHVRENDGFTAATGPFPWYAPPATTPATPAATPATQAGGNAPSSGGNTTP